MLLLRKGSFLDDDLLEDILATLQQGPEPNASLCVQDAGVQGSCVVVRERVATVAVQAKADPERGKRENLLFPSANGIMQFTRASSSDGQSACLTYTRSGVQVPSRPPEVRLAVVALGSWLIV